MLSLHMRIRTETTGTSHNACARTLSTRRARRLHALLSVCVCVCVLHCHCRLPCSGNGHPRCLLALQEYGGRVDTRASMLLSLRRRGADAQRSALVRRASTTATKDRLGKIVAVWERVLDAAAARSEGALTAPGVGLGPLAVGPHAATPRGTTLGPGPPRAPGRAGAPAAVASPSGSIMRGVGAGSAGRGVPQPGAGGGQLLRCYDPSTGCDYFLDPTSGASTWATTAPRCHAGPVACAVLVDPGTRQSYVVDAVTGDAEWLPEGSGALVGAAAWGVAAAVEEEGESLEEEEEEEEGESGWVSDGRGWGGVRVGQWRWAELA
jgi:hypothetical protein